MSAPSLFVSECHGAYTTPIPGTQMWRCHECDEACAVVRFDKHPRWAENAPSSEKGHPAQNDGTLTSGQVPT